ncbi:MAG: branched-chain amino acid ABC transporter permease [Anaerolineae bacterium]|nr:branched-chain amino acid ABC transporter permease [Anaerolineae bacterium]MDW8068730.1 branched-chain amino acid ABC transporter permease [Anaerolineae bacterium]
MVTTIIEVVITGLLMGGLYALIAVGLSLQYGVARILNISHGEFIMLGGLTTWSLYTALGVNPLLSLAICGPLAFALGFVIHRTLFKRLLDTAASPGVFESNSMLAAFGLMFIIQNVALIAWGSEIRGYSYLTTPVHFLGTLFGANRLLTFGMALLIGLVFYLFLNLTRTGKAIRAAAQDPTTAGLMGVNINHMLALCFGLGAAMAGVGGVLISMCYPVHGVMGLEYTVIAIIVVVLGGLGSIPGSFMGGFILGLVGSIVTFLEPGLALVAYYVIFILLLLIRPTGLLGR